MPTCVFIPIAAQSLSLPVHVKNTEILNRDQYHSSRSLSHKGEHQHDFREGKNEVYLGDNECHFYL